MYSEFEHRGRIGRTMRSGNRVRIGQPYYGFGSTPTSTTENPPAGRLRGYVRQLREFAPYDLDKWTSRITELYFIVPHSHIPIYATFRRPITPRHWVHVRSLLHYSLTPRLRFREKE